MCNNLGVVNIVGTKSIEGLPVDSVLEEVSLFLHNKKGQIVLLHAKVEEFGDDGRKLFETDKTGTKIGEEELFDIKRITYVQRS